MFSRMRLTGIVGLLVVVGLVAAACGGGNGAPAGGNGDGGDLVIIAEEFSFSPSQIELNVGEEVTLTLQNDGAQLHDLHVDGARMRVNGQETNELHVEADPGQSVSVTVTALEAGTFEIICHVPGHREAGMTGTLTVTD